MSEWQAQGLGWLQPGLQQGPHSLLLGGTHDSFAAVWLLGLATSPAHTYLVVLLWCVVSRCAVGGGGVP